MLPLTLACAQHNPGLVSISSHYDALNLETSASPSQIKTSYIAIARKNHPDVTNDPAVSVSAYDRRTALNANPVNA